MTGRKTDGVRWFRSADTGQRQRDTASCPACGEEYARTESAVVDDVPATRYWHRNSEGTTEFCVEYADGRIERVTETDAGQSVESV